MLGVPSSVAVERIRTSYLGLLTDAVQALTGVPHAIELVVDTAPRADADDALRAAAGRAGRRRSSSGPAPAEPEPAEPLAQHAAESPLHLRPVRHRRLEPLRARRGAQRRREPGPVVQPAVHLRAGRARANPPAARDRPPRPRAVLEQAHSLRLDRDDDERIRRRDALEGHARLQTPLPRGRRAARRRHPVPRAHRAAPGGVLLHVQRPARPRQPDRDLLRPAAEVDRDHRRPAAQPLRVGPHHRHPAAGVRDPPRDPAQEGRSRAPRRHPRRRARVHRRQRRRQRP